MLYQNRHMRSSTIESPTIGQFSRFFLALESHSFLSSSVAELEARLAGVVAPLAKRFNLSLNAFADKNLSIEDPSAFGQLILSDAYGSGLNPAPITPTFGSGPWELLSGTILFTFTTNQRGVYADQQLLVAPGLNIGGYFLGSYMLSN